MCQICGKKADEIIRGRAYEFNPLYEKVILEKELKIQKQPFQQKSVFDIDIFISFEIDHIIPECRGGITKAQNLRLTCRRCNRIRR